MQGIMEVLALFVILILQCRLVLVDKNCVVGNGTRVNLSKRNIERVPRDLAHDTVDLNLSRNQITALNSRLFYTLSKLQRLDLSYNEISHIDKDALMGLDLLCHLDLRGNKINFCNITSYPVSLFDAVPFLKVLHLEEIIYVIDRVSKFTYVYCRYNDDFYRPLNNIHDLSIDATVWPSSLKFGSGFVQMALLEKLLINFRRHDVGITDSTLLAFRHSNLHTIIIQGVKYISPGAFTNLKNIDKIIIRNSPILGLKVALMSLDGLQHRNMTSIVLSGVNPAVPDGKTGIENFFLNVTIFKYLSDICVKSIHLSDNHLLGTNDVLEVRSFKYPGCITDFNFKGNNIASDDYIQLVYYLFGFPNIRHVDISWGNGIIGNEISNLEKDNYSPEENTSVQYFDTFKCSYNTRMVWIISYDEIIKAKVFDMAYSSSCTPLFYNETWPRLEVLNISGCKLTNGFIVALFPKLEILAARATNLKFVLERDRNGEFLKVFPKLKHLDIANNGLSYLHPRMFAGISLETLEVSDNKLLSILPAIRSLRSLTTLHLANNAITQFTWDEREWVEQISLRSENSAIINAEGNPFACLCKTIDFVQWLLERDFTSSIVNTSTCYFENGTQISFLDLKDDFKNFVVGCVSRFWLTFAISVGCVVAVGIVASITYYRLRWNIKYWFMTKCRKTPENELIDLADYPFDAFVAYNHEDYVWTYCRLRTALEEGEHPYRLCLHHRDFPVGESIQQNIVDAINSSRKIILVITKKYLACDWGEFEIQMASMRAFQSGRDNIIIAILLEEIPVRKMPRSLLNMWKHITFLLWRDDPVDERIFWARLLDSIKR